MTLSFLFKSETLLSIKFEMEDISKRLFASPSVYYFLSVSLSLSLSIYGYVCVSFCGKWVDHKRERERERGGDL